MYPPKSWQTYAVLAVLASLGAAVLMSNSPIQSHAEKAHAEKTLPQEGKSAKPAATDLAAPKDATLEQATFGGGCFWCTEAVYQELQGVFKVTSGYSGGRKADPSYKDISTGLTGHAEVIQIDFDPETNSV